MDILLWRWSTAVQLTSLLMVAGFFVVLARSSRRVEVKWWVLAWGANATALAVTVFFWFAQPSSLALAIGGYTASKLAFVLWLLLGALAVGRPGADLPPHRVVLTAVAAYGFVCALFIPSISVLGLVQHAVMGALLISGVVALAGEWRHVAWLLAALAARGALSFVESGAYWVDLDAAGQFSAAAREQAAWLLAASSTFDTAVEWFVALGCVLAVSERAQRELTQTNLYLLEAQEHLRHLADRDPLTALENRRALLTVFRDVRPEGAAVLFLDLDGFKQINDLYGHVVGDQCLVRFANAVRESFRPSDAGIRYGGDEVLVVAPGMDEAAAHARVADLRERLADSEPRLQFSVGLAMMPVGGSPDQALHDADRAMYQWKRRA